MQGKEIMIKGEEDAEQFPDWADSEYDLNAVKEEQNAHIPSEGLSKTSELSADQQAARDDFRNRVGFQVCFILYSGLEVETAIEHICGLADKLVERIQATESDASSALSNDTPASSLPHQSSPERDLLLAAAKAALKWVDNLDESRPTSATCPRCTDGSVPNRFNEGLCSLCQLEDQLNAAVKGTK